MKPRATAIRFTVLINAQYARELSTLERLELKLLSAIETNHYKGIGDYRYHGSHMQLVAVQQIKKLQALYDQLKEDQDDTDPDRQD